MKALAMAASVTMVLAACAAYGPGDVRIGQSSADITHSMGAPTGRYALPDGGTRLEFARGPAGLQTYMVDLDAKDHVTRWQQVMTEDHFAHIAAGQARDEVLRQLGHPANVRYIGWQKLVVWAYRYDTPMCQWFQVSLDERGVVHDVAYGPDPRCEAGDIKAKD